eukprot:jgi/Astpho2/2768/Aster-00943
MVRSGLVFTFHIAGLTPCYHADPAADANTAGSPSDDQARLLQVSQQAATSGAGITRGSFEDTRTSPAGPAPSGLSRGESVFERIWGSPQSRQADERTDATPRAEGGKGRLDEGEACPPAAALLVRGEALLRALASYPCCVVCNRLLNDLELMLMEALIRVKTSL